DDIVTIQEELGIVSYTNQEMAEEADKNARVNEAYQILHRVRKLNQNVVHVLTNLRGDNLLTDREDLLHFISYRCNVVEYPDLEEAHCLLADHLSEYDYDISVAEDCLSINSKITENNEGKELLLN
ncbi:23137_t:CDS:2, partial [Racocetra persica]